MTAPLPLVPPEVDLRDFQFMPLDVRRLRDSKLVAVRSPEEVVAAILLWSASWHQQPASSLPDDDVELSSLAGYGGVRGVALFRKIKGGALYGFVLCADGRWYHPVVAEKAADGWNAKLDTQHYRASERIRKENIERKEKEQPELPKLPKPEHLSGRSVDGIVVYRQWKTTNIPSEPSAKRDSVPPETHQSSAGIPAETTPKGEGQGEVRDRDSKGTGTGNIKQQQRALGSPTKAPTRRGEITARARAAGVDATPGMPQVVAWEEAGVTDAQLDEAIERARLHKPVPQKIPTAYLDPIVREVMNPQAVKAALPAKRGRTSEPDFSTLNYREGVSDDGRF